MQIIEKRLEELKVYENNPRNNDKAVNAVAESILQFGFKVPLVIDTNDVIVCGHTRLKASKKLGLDTVPCIVADDLTEEQIKAFRLADNKTAELAEWDVSKLEEELKALAEMDFDMSAFDFDVSEFEEPKEVVEDDVPEVSECEPVAQLGDIWKLGEHRLMCGDSTDVLNINILMQGRKADLVFTDPPYGIDVVGGNGKVGADNLAKNGVYKPVKGDETTETAEKAFDVVKTVSERQMLWGGNYFTEFLPYSDGWVIWDKRGEMNSNNFADGEMCWCSFHTPVRIYKQVWSGMIREGEREKRVHPTQKPIKVLADILRDFSKEGDVILDCFGGSGSTLIACEQINRKCYMVEYEPYYCDVIIKRWETLTGKKAELVKN